MNSSKPKSAPGLDSSAPRWYQGVSGYQWLVLAVASAGWMFDSFESQIFNLTRGQMLADILKVSPTDPLIKHYGDVFLAIFLAGGTFGGLLFGSLADRLGRRPSMIITILMYSVFSGLTYFATSLWQVAALRFLVAIGVGGEWAAAASLVSEIFPKHSRAHASGIFQFTSILGTWMATLAGIAVGANWRFAYLLGIAPALLVLWVRSVVKEPERWAEAKENAKGGGPQLGSFTELLMNPRWRRRALLGMSLAAVGLGSFWGVTVAGQDLTREFLLKLGTDPAQASQSAKFAYGIVETAGGGLGLLAFGPLCVRIGRKSAFVWMHIGAFLIVPITCYLPATYWQMLMVLPLFGFLTLGIHSGYAIYFPELFPNHLRATGSGFCFNGGRLLAASVLIFSGWLKALPHMDLRLAVTLLAFLFPLGIVIVYFLPETRNQPLPE